jgi:Ca2+-binding EF-hand superfamily protein
MEVAWIIHTTKEVVMMKKQLLAALTLITVSGFAWAGSDTASFQDLDKNHDGQISRDEAKQSPQVSKNFDRADANKDGKLDSAEFAAVEAAPIESMPKETK